MIVELIRKLLSICSRLCGFEISFYLSANHITQVLVQDECQFIGSLGIDGVGCILVIKTTKIHQQASVLLRFPSPHFICFLMSVATFLFFLFVGPDLNLK